MSDRCPNSGGSANGIIKNKNQFRGWKLWGNASFSVNPKTESELVDAAEKCIKFGAKDHAEIFIARIEGTETKERLRILLRLR